MTKTCFWLLLSVGCSCAKTVYRGKLRFSLAAIEGDELALEEAFYSRLFKQIWVSDGETSNYLRQVVSRI